MTDHWQDILTTLHALASNAPTFMWIGFIAAMAVFGSGPVRRLTGGGR